MGRLEEHIWERLTSFDLFAGHNDREKVLKSDRLQCLGDNGQNSSGGYRYLGKSSDLAREIGDFPNRPNRADSSNIELLLFVGDQFRDRVRYQTARSKIQPSCGLAIRREHRIDSSGICPPYFRPCRPRLRNDPAWSRPECHRSRRYSLRIAFRVE